MTELNCFEVNYGVNTYREGAKNVRPYKVSAITS